MAYRGAKPSMPGVGPLGRNLIVNLERLRHARGLSYRKLAAAMNETARPIPAIGFSRIMAAERREVGNLVTRIEQMLASSGDRETAGMLSGYVDRALRRVQIEVEELLAGVRAQGAGPRGYSDEPLV